MLTQSGRWRGWLTRVPRAISCPPRWPNRPIQPTPLAASEIDAILTVGICYNVITIYSAARLMGNMFGRKHHALCARLTLDRSPPKNSLHCGRAKGALHANQANDHPICHA
jgi:hypothetical protein